MSAMFAAVVAAAEGRLIEAVISGVAKSSAADYGDAYESAGELHSRPRSLQFLHKWDKCMTLGHVSADAPGEALEM